MRVQESLSSRWYVDPAVYEEEKKRIFSSAWWLLGPSFLVESISQYMSDVVSGWPVFVIRGEDGALRGFRNVCRHRGSTLLEEGCGLVNSLRCPYHGWLYDTKGNFLKAPKFGIELENFEENLNLYPIDVHVWNELVFVKIEPNAGVDFDSWLGEIAGYCSEFPSPSNLDYHDEFTIDAETNWKTYCDNTVEGYHLNLVHLRLAKSIAGANVELRSFNEGRSVAFVIDHKEGTDGAEQRGQKGFWVYHFPGFQMVLGEKVFKAERVEALAVNRTCSKNWAWYGKEMSMNEKEDAFQWSKTIVKEDFGICTRVFQNMMSGNYTTGPLSPEMEKHVARFQEIVRHCIEQA